MSGINVCAFWAIIISALRDTDSNLIALDFPLLGKEPIYSCRIIVDY
ncbi:MAG: hypothetical protein ACFFAS_10520 [Promethearchaeota archaeon]